MASAADPAARQRAIEAYVGQDAIAQLMASTGAHEPFHTSQVSLDLLRDVVADREG